MNVGVVGAGAVGCCAALELAGGGADVTVYERGEAVAAGSSGRAAGVAYAAFAEDVDAAIGARSLDRFRDLSGTGEFTFEPCPYVMLAAEGDEQRASALRDAAAGMARNGADVAVLDGAAFGERFPAVRSEDVGVAVVADEAGWCRPEGFVRAVAGLARDAGATIHTGESVAVDPDGPAVVRADGAHDRFDAVLVAAGAWTAKILDRAGVAIPLKPYRVQAFVAPGRYDGPMVFDATANLYLRPHPRGLLAGDGTVPEEVDSDAFDREADDWFLADTGDAVSHRLDRAVDPERAWAGLCTATPDTNPLLGELRAGLYVAAGWQGHGFMRAPGTGAVVAEQILGTGDCVAAFDPTRFDGDESFEVTEGMAIEGDD